MYSKGVHRILVTGGAGFIGSNLVSQLLATAEEPVTIIVFDALTYAADLQNLPDDSRLEVVVGDVRDFDLLSKQVFRADEIFHLAAESHVDRSINNSRIFIETNTLGTQNVLEAVRLHDKRLVLVSTDEVYGSLEHGYAEETSVLRPSSPYSASKAAADLLALAYFKTYKTDVVITRCTNNYGPNQYPEKLIPVVIESALQGAPIPIYGDGTNVRDWIHVSDHCSGLILAMEKGKPGEIYNFGDVEHIQNVELVSLILDYLSESNSKIEFIADRPGHDFRYAVNSRKSRETLGWTPSRNMTNSLAETVEHYLAKFSNQY